MLSGPPASLAAAINRSQIASRVAAVSPRTLAMMSVVSTPDSPSRQRARHDVTPRMLPRRRFRHRPRPDLFLDPRVIVRDLAERAVAHRVDAAVADVGHAGRRAARQHRRRGRRHPAQIRGVRHGVRDLPVRQTERGLQAIAFQADRRLEGERPGAVLVGARGFGNEGLDGLDGDARRDFARDMAAHAVGHHEQADVGTGAVTVFVTAAAKAGVRADGPGELHVNAEC